MPRIVYCLCSCFLLGFTTVAGASHYEIFFGRYVGATSYMQNGKEVQRDLSVEITPAKTGFNVKWTTTKVKASGETKSKSYSRDFVPSGREHIYSSAMKANLFGGREPLDPMKGDPYVWAKIHDNVMTIYAMLITEEGGYEMLTYERTLTEEGITVVFNRIGDGNPQRQVKATLKKVSDN